MAKFNKYLFTWQEVESHSDMERLVLCLENLPDERLMKILEEQRGKGRNDYPVRPMWNALIAGIVFQHKSIESLRRELSRNGELRDVCGFDPVLGSEAVPSSSAFTRFLKRLMRNIEELELIFDSLVEELGKYLPDFGKRLAIDSKELRSAGKPTKKERDGRRDVDADWGKKRYRGVNRDGTLWERFKKWFGYKLHLIVDSEYEIPVSYKVTKASVSDIKEAKPLLESHIEKHSEVGSRAEVLVGDRGYDSTEFIRDVYDDYDIKPVIEIRNMWKEGGDKFHCVEGEPVTRQLNPDEADNIVYDYKGEVYCVCPLSNKHQRMAFNGFEKDRKSLRYSCPALSYGMECAGKKECKHYMKRIRIPLDLNRRIFTPIARSSYKWDREYKRRTSVERVNSRIDVSFGFEHHFIRGKLKMETRVGLALIVMLSMALGHIKAGRKRDIRKLVKFSERMVKKKAA